MPDPIHLQLDRFGDIVAYKFETGMADPARNVGLPAGEVIVKTDHLIAAFHQPVDQMGAEEAGTSSDEVDQNKRRNVLPECGDLLEKL